MDDACQSHPFPRFPSLKILPVNWIFGYRLIAVFDELGLKDPSLRPSNGSNDCGSSIGRVSDQIEMRKTFVEVICSINDYVHTFLVTLPDIQQK